MEKDIVDALIMYEMKEYKNYYLACIDLVTQAKFQGDCWLQGYCYYMRAAGLDTFLEARKRGVVLQDDFEEKERQEFNEEWLQKKREKDLQKAKEGMGMMPNI